VEPVAARVEAIARRALERLGSAPSDAITAGAAPRDLRIAHINMPQLVRLVYLQAGEPLVDQVLAALKAGRPVYMDRPAIEAALGLAEYPPRLQEQFNRWFSRLAGYGIALVADHPSPLLLASGGALSSRPVSPPPPGPPPRSSGSTVARPEQAIFSEILGEAVPEPHPCVKEPGRACCGSGRCKTLGF
jgi:hypothetical protein